MFRSLVPLGKVLCLLSLSAVVFMGCPPGLVDLGSAIMVLNEDALLDFGTSETVLELYVVKTFGSNALDPIYVTSDYIWITPLACAEGSLDCVSSGPDDMVTIPIQINRSLVPEGVSQGTVVIHSGLASVQYVDVVVEKTPKTLDAEFSASETIIPIGGTVDFTNLSYVAPGMHPITGYCWDFGDGTNSHAQNPSHQYTQPGQYTVSLVITSLDGTDTEVKTDYITVPTPDFTVDFEGAPRYIDAGDSVDFTDMTDTSGEPELSRLWNFGDGATSTEMNPSHTYAFSGFYTVSLTVATQYEQKTETKTQYIGVQNTIPPTAFFAWPLVEPYVNTPVHFGDLSDPGTSTITAWEWDFGDGATSTDQHPTHTFTSVQSYTVTLTVTTAHGQDTYSNTVNVVYMPPTAAFSADKLFAEIFSVVTFTDESLDGSEPIVSWQWDFGDGFQSTQQHPTHIYTEEGLYTVTLTVLTSTPTGNTDTEIKAGYIQVLTPPEAGFIIDSIGVFNDEPVSFINQTVPGSEPVTYFWDFGDESSSNQENPSHLFTQPGEYTVTLTVNSEHFQDTYSQSLVVDAPPLPAFGASKNSLVLGEEATFNDTGQRDGRRPVTNVQWAFGDGVLSNQPMPTHSYVAVGDYSPSLTYSFTHSDTGYTFTRTVTRENFMHVTEPIAPLAAFRANTVCAKAGMPVYFTDLSLAGSTPITDWEWDFDGEGASTDQHPDFIFMDEGIYSVTLTVTAADTFPGYATDTLTKTALIAVDANPGTLMDAIVREPQSSYEYQPVRTDFAITTSKLGTLNMPVATGHVLRMTSLSWRSAAEILYGHEWDHHIIIADPLTPTNNSALLFLAEGELGTPPPATTYESLGIMANLTGSQIIWVDNIPAQPLSFASDIEPERFGDELATFSHDQFLDTGDPDWVQSTYTAKAVVKTMDTVQEFLGLSAPDDFVLTGSGKARALATWTANAVDCRIRAIAPMAFEGLNLDQALQLQYAALGGQWGDAWAPYEEFNVLFSLNNPLSPTEIELNYYLSPYNFYLDYMDKGYLPKLLVNGTGDECFTPDSSFTYLDMLDFFGNFHFSYIANADNTIGNNLYLNDGAFAREIQVLLAWYMEVVQDVPRPEITVDYTDSTLSVENLSPVTPTSVMLYEIVNPIRRDFRRSTILAQGISATVIPLTATPGNENLWEVTVDEPLNGWKAFFVQLVYPNGAVIAAPGLDAPDMTISTDVRVIPDEMPPPGIGGWGTIETMGTGDDEITLVKVGGTRYEMGYWYGRLLASQIAAVWSNLDTYIGAPEGVWDFAIGSMWNSMYFDTDAWEQELMGMVQGCAEAGHPEMTFRIFQKMLALADLSEYNCGLFAIWGDATADGHLYQLRNLDWAMDTGAQDYPVVAYYYPEDGEEHAVIGFAGMIGAAVGGINQHGIAVSEIMGGFGDAETLSGIPYPVLLRDALYFDTTLNQALTRMQTATRTNEYHYCISGPDGLGGQDARLLFTSNTRFDQFGGGDPVLPHPKYDPFYTPLTDVVYWKRHDGGAYATPGPEDDRKGNQTLFAAINARYGTITATEAIEIAVIDGVDGTVVSIVYDTTAKKFWVAYAEGPTIPAHLRPYVEFDLTD